MDYQVMGYVFYSDESGTSIREKCYAIGAILVPDKSVSKFNTLLNDLTTRHKIKSEIKWEHISKSYNMMNFALDVLREILDGPYIFTSIVVLKSAYRKWQSNQEEAFYTTYTLLLENSARQLKDVIRAEIDDKSDAYSKQAEVVEIIANYKLKDKVGEISKVTKIDSKKLIELQAADILTGAVNAAHQTL